MRKLLFLIFGLLPFCSLTSAQNKILLYFNKDWEVTTKEKAVYMRVAEYDLQNFKLNGKVTDRDSKGIPVMEGNYYEGKRNGEFTFYFGSGNVDSKGSYANNNRIGKWIYYYPDGKLKQTIRFLPNKRKGGFLVGEYYDRSGKQLIKKGTGKWVNDSIQSGLSNNSEYLRVTGKFRDSLLNRKWKLIRISDKQILQIEQYQMGAKVISFHISSKNPENQTRTGQRLKDEMRSGIAHENLFGNTSVREIDDLPWIKEREEAVQEINGSNELGTKSIPSHLMNKYNPNTKSATISAENILGNVQRTMEKIPDQNVWKLNRTEKVVLDKNDFQDNTTLIMNN